MSDANLSPGARETCLQEMATTASRFDLWSVSWKHCLNLIRLPDEIGTGPNFRHSSKKLLQVIRLVLKLRGGSSTLADVIAKSLALALPSFMQPAFLNDISDLVADVKAAMPSAALVRRYELALDAAMMLLQRKAAEADRADGSSCIRMGLTDLSPMAGFDWLWSEYHEIRQDNLVATFQAVVSLTCAIAGHVRDREPEFFCENGLHRTVCVSSNSSGSHGGHWTSAVWSHTPR
jgi:hypothetical protein